MSKEGTFTHRGKLYDLDRLLSLVGTRQPVRFPVAKLSWIIDECPPVSSERMAKVDRTKPILIVKDFKPATVDGLHRLTIAHELGDPFISAIIVRSGDLQSCYIRDAA